MSDAIHAEATAFDDRALAALASAGLIRRAGKLADVTSVASEDDESVVVAIPVFGNSCPPVLRVVDIGEGVIDARFGRSPATSCDDVGVIYGFVIAVDRSISPDPVTVTWTDASGVPTDGVTSYDLRSGAVVAGGLVLPEFGPAFVDCSDADLEPPKAAKPKVRFHMVGGPKK